MARVAAYDAPPTELTSDLRGDKRAFILQIAFPIANFGASLPMILTTLLGNDVSTSIR